MLWLGQTTTLCLELLLGFLDMKEGAGISHANIQPSVPVFIDITIAGDSIGDASLGGYQMDTTGFKLRGMELFHTAGSLQGTTVWLVSKNTRLWGKLF